MPCVFSGMLSSHITEMLPLLSEYFCNAPKLQFRKSPNEKAARPEAELEDFQKTYFIK